tara:strand:+ start:18243 stop:18479 length:237 start_codon:yes stop_codon:yes gene_type:complete
MTEREILIKEIDTVETSIAEVRKNLEDLTQILGRMNFLHNIFNEHLNTHFSDPNKEVDKKDKESKGFTFKEWGTEKPE